MSKYSLSEEEKSLYVIHFAKFLVQYYAKNGVTMILSEAIKIANSRVMGWSKKPSVFKYMLTLKDYQTLDHSNLIEKARKLKEIKAIEKLRMKKEKEKIIFKDEDEINLYIMYYASYISKLRAFRNEKDIILKKINVMYKKRDTSLSACLKTAKKYVEWHCTGEFDLLVVSLKDFQTLSFEEIRKKYYD